MDISKLVGSGVDGVMPSEIAPIVKGLIEGTIKQLVVIAETDRGTFIDAFPILDDSAHRLGMVGAIDMVKRDYMRCMIVSRVEYVEKTDENEGEDD